MKGIVAGLILTLALAACGADGEPVPPGQSAALAGVAGIVI